MTAVRRSGRRPIGATPAMAATSSPQAPAAGRLVADLLAGRHPGEAAAIVPLVDPARCRAG